MVGSRSYKKILTHLSDRYSLLSSVTYTMSLGALPPSDPRGQRAELLLPIHRVGEKETVPSWD